MIAETELALSEVTDEGLFERIATAALRIGDARYASLAHPGVNAKGQTRKSPVDGVTYLSGASPTHIVAAHHTSTAPASLRMKWLNDPNPRAQGAVATRAKGAASTVLGDIAKTAAVVAQARLDIPGLEAILVLTTNQEVDANLMTAVKAAGAKHGIEIDIWSRSRIAHVLDHTADGQSVRRRLLGIAQDRLSRDLLADLGIRSAAAARPPDDPKAWVARAIDADLTPSAAGATFIVGDSGSGKSVASHGALTRHLADGGFGIVVHNETIAASPTLEVAIANTLKDLHPALANGENFGAVLLPGETFLVVIEDINRSAQPYRLLEKLAGWMSVSLGGDNGDDAIRHAHMICPVWPSTIAGVSDSIRRIVQDRQIEVGRLSVREASQAVLARAALAGREISSADAVHIAERLGRDPLLIALHDPLASTDPDDVISDFIDSALLRCQAATHEPASALRDALLATTERMLDRRKLEPRWSDLARWDLEAGQIQSLKHLVGHGEIVRLEGNSSDQRLLFRHDRVRDWLFSEILVQKELSCVVDDRVLSDPFLSHIIAASLVRLGTPIELLDRLRRANPLVLFEAMRSVGPGEDRSRIVSTIEHWCASSDGAAEASATMLWRAETALMDVDGQDVPTLVASIPGRSVIGSIAAMRNGDVQAGIAVARRFGFGTNAPFRDRQVDHAKLHHGNKMVDELAAMLRQGTTDRETKESVLCFVGQLADARLAEAIAECWARDEARHEFLQAYLWAAGNCCTEASAADLLGPICDAWRALPDGKPSEPRASPRDELAAHSIRHGFTLRPPIPAIQYLVARREDPA